MKLPTGERNGKRMMHAVRCKISMVLLVVSNVMLSQEVLVRGTVSDDAGPLPNATVSVKGTGTSTRTDIGGNYAVKAAFGDYLEFSFPEFIKQEKRIEQKEINVKLDKQPDVASIGTGRKSLPDVTVVSTGDIYRTDNNTSPLPEIKEVSYIALPTALARIFPPNSCQDDVPKFLKNYSRRLDNIRHYEVYLVEQRCEFSQTACLCFQETAQGTFDFLVLFDRKTKQAKVFIASYSFLSDSEVYSMTFDIKNHTIRLTDAGTTEGENGEGEEFSKNLIVVTVSKSGKIKVKSEHE